MKIFELLNQPGQQLQQPEQDDEDNEGKFDADKVDQNLQDISNQIDDQQAQPVQPGQDQQQQPPELDDMNTKPIDSGLLSQIKSLPYVKKYNFDDKNPLNPIKISAMKIEELTALQSKVRYKMQILTLKDQVGMDDDKNMEFCNDLSQFINTVLHFKKSNTSAQLSQYRSAPSYQSQ